MTFLALLLSLSGGVPSASPDFSERFASLALDCVHREYPNKVSHVLHSDRDAKPPRRLTPAFYGCYDWHSAVHGHWLLARLARRFPDAPFASKARAALAKSLSPARLRAEAAYLRGEGRGTFERPYGLAWLLQLSNELHGWDAPEAKTWAAALAPLEAEVAARFLTWLPKLSRPVRTGEHSQTAFALGLLLDWADARGHTALATLARQRARDFYERDVTCPLAYEPGGEDFLSPCLAEADLMRRVLSKATFSTWLRQALPQIPTTEGGAAWLQPAVSTDRSDGKLAHLDGLNLSRAWMLEGLAAALPADDARLPALRRAADAHRKAGLAAVTGEHYEGGHWLGTFATYLVFR